MSIFLKFTKIHWTPVHLTRRHFSELYSKLKNTDQISTLHKSREDVASFVRWNRNFRAASTDNFQELFSKSANPDKTEHELEEIRLKVALICAEYEYLIITNTRLPAELKLEDMQAMIDLKNHESRQGFLIKSYFKDTLKIREKVKKILKKNRRPERMFEFTPGCFAENGDLQYGLWKNSLFTRLHQQQYRQRSQLAINSILRGQVVAFDWDLVDFPEKALSQDLPVFNNPAHKRFYQLLSSKIFKICNHNYKSNHCCHDPLHIVHCSLGDDNPLRKYLQESFDASLLDSQFFECLSNSYLIAFPDKRIVYVNPLAREVLSDEDISYPEETVFVFNPFQEFMGLNRRELEVMFQKKIEKDAQNVCFRRLPIHDWTHNNSGHISLSHYIQGFSDVLQGSTWLQVLKRYVPRKHYKIECLP